MQAFKIAVQERNFRVPGCADRFDAADGRGANCCKMEEGNSARSSLLEEHFDL